MLRLLTEKNRIHGLVNERIIRRIFNYSSFWCKIETCDGIKFSEIQSHRNHIRIERTRRRCVTWIIDRVCINRLHKFIVWSHFSTKNLYNSGTDESRREENKEINRESTIGIDGKLVEAFSKRPRLVEKKQARTIVRRWRAKSAAWPQPRSSDVKAFRWKGGEGKEGCDRIALRLLEPLNIAGRISLAFARPTALLDFPRPRFMRNECVSTPLSLPRHRPRRIHTVVSNQYDSTRNARPSLLFEISQRARKKCSSPSTPPYCSSPPISTFSGEYYVDEYLEF